MTDLNDKTLSEWLREQDFSGHFGHLERMMSNAAIGVAASGVRSFLSSTPLRPSRPRAGDILYDVEMEAARRIERRARARRWARAEAARKLGEGRAVYNGWMRWSLGYAHLVSEPAAERVCYMRGTSVGKSEVQLRSYERVFVMRGRQVGGRGRDGE